MDLKTKSWFYDELSVLFDKKEGEDQSRIKKMQRATNAQMGVGKPFVFTRTSPIFGDTIEIPFSCPDSFKPYAEMDLDNFASAMQFRRNFKRAHPILIGPATLESLLDKPVDNYDYIRTGKLPFNPLFFEFTEKVNATIPRVKRSDVSLEGIYLCADTSKASPTYVFTSLWKDKSGEIMGIDLFMNDPRSTFFLGQVSHISRPNFDLDLKTIDKNRFQFMIDNDTIHICRSREKEAALGNHLYHHKKGPVYAKEFFDESIPLSSIPHTVFDMVPSLSTNLINYINAHNVTLITKDRQEPSLEPITTLTENKKYSLVVVKDEVHRGQGDTHQGHILTYQLAIRGHNRRLRNEDGQVRMVSWIPPYIKGPDGAPFYDTRHEVTAKKIFAERELYKI